LFVGGDSVAQLTKCRVVPRALRARGRDPDLSIPRSGAEYRLATKRLKQAEDWLTSQRALWERRLDQFDSYVTKLNEKGK
jgi:hypothetical protein